MDWVPICVSTPWKKILVFVLLDKTAPFMSEACINEWIFLGVKLSKTITSFTLAYCINFSRASVLSPTNERIIFSKVLSNYSTSRQYKKNSITLILFI